MTNSLSSAGSANAATGGVCMAMVLFSLLPAGETRYGRARAKSANSTSSVSGGSYSTQIETNQTQNPYSLLSLELPAERPMTLTLLPDDFLSSLGTLSCT